MFRQPLKSCFLFVSHSVGISIIALIILYSNIIFKYYIQIKVNVNIFGKDTDVLLILAVPIAIRSTIVENVSRKIPLKYD